MADISVSTLVATLAFVLGILFGATVNRTGFCAMGSISDIVFLGDWSRFRAWMLAGAVAILGTQFLHLSGLIDTGKSIYLTPNLGWLGAIIGGLMFGFGMTLAGGCGSKTLVRLGSGNLKSLIVFLVLGFCSYMTLRGLLALPRLQIETANVNLSDLGIAGQGIPDLVAAVTGLDKESLRPWLAGIVGLGILAWCFKDSAFRASTRNVLAGIVLGAIIVAGWVATGIAGADDFEPAALASFSFVAPIGNSMQYLMTYTGSTINFGVASVGGVITGSFLAAILTRSFVLEGFADMNDLLRHLTGAALMGIGGVLALGCTIGQGVTGLSTLALSSFIALASIICGGVLGMRYLAAGSLKAIFSKSHS